MNSDEVIACVEKAFANVHLGSGIGLWEAQAIDDYELEEVRKQKRTQDEKEDWALLSSSDLQRCHSSLSFFDADAMRFHLPAFIVGSLRDEVDDPVFHLTHLDDYAQSKFTTMNRDQIAAVICYLNWCLDCPEYDFEKPMINRALDEYWSTRNS